ncbi:tyrosine-type recombinase/integrase [Syntrophothermus lipocalidus]|uniref:Integrase family protein n=1 Tax=Syntrophothermus lipocalidus (strain DSM 12680 / TGB-C1) TaxID=643648 RepID=D7CIR5_SYNLT|nr:tyrosine-type recombinase/integrase [Syntrophothermus lipocalidus]ADI02793.1 integrase family protein [Syntrophothermus lipocalidus DSM 12680]
MKNVVYLGKKMAHNWESVLERYEDYLKTTRARLSVESYMGDLRLFLEWLGGRGEDNPTAVTPLDASEYRRFLADKGYKPATINRKIQSLRAFYGWLQEAGIVPDNPFRRTKAVPAQELAPRWLTRPEQAALMRAVRAKGRLRDEAMIALMLFAGLKVGELVALEREDVVVRERSGKVVVRQGKGNKRREVPLNATARDILRRWLEENPTGPLWPSQKGGRLSKRQVQKIVEDCAYIAKLKDVTCHKLRHTFCKNLLDAGVSIDQVAAMAGHSRLDVTKRYTVPSMQDLQEAVERTSWE